MLLSFIPLSYTVVLIRELANTLFPTSANILTTIPMTYNTSNININININITRERLTSSSKNSSQESLTHSAASLVLYYKRMEIQSNNSLWSKQVENEERNSFSSLYASLKKEDRTLVKKAINNNSTDCCSNHLPEWHL